MAASLPDCYLSPRLPAAGNAEDADGAGLTSPELSLSGELEQQEPHQQQQQQQQKQQTHQKQKQQQQKQPPAAPEEERRPAEGLVSGAAPAPAPIPPRPRRRPTAGIFDHQAGDGAVSPPPRPRQPPPTAADWGAASEPRPDYGDGEAAPPAAPPTLQPPPPPLQARPSGRRRWRRPAPAGWCSDDSNPAEAAARRREPPDDASVTSLDSEAATGVTAAESRGTSPSVLSTGSVASSRRLEWDAAADVGYQAAAPRLAPADSLSTLERIAIGSYAGVLRSEPEGTGRPAAPRRRHRPLLCRAGHHQETITEEAERRRGSHERSPVVVPPSPSSSSSEEEDGEDEPGRSGERQTVRRSLPRDASARAVRRAPQRRVSPRPSPGRRPRPVSAEVHRQRRGRLTAKKSSSLSELSASPHQNRQPLQRRGDRSVREALTFSPPPSARRSRDRAALTSASSSRCSSDGGDGPRCSNALFFTSCDTLVALPGHVPLPVTLSKLDSSRSQSQSSPNSSLPLSGGGSLKRHSSEQASRQSIQTVVFVGGGVSEDAENCAGARPPDSDRSAAAGGAVVTSGRSSLDQLPTRDTGRPAVTTTTAVMSYLETSEGSCYSSAYAMTGGGALPMSSTLRDSVPSTAELSPWVGGGSSSLAASRDAYTSAASVSRDGRGGAAFRPAGSAGLLLEERTETVAEEDSGRRVTQTVRRALANHPGADSYRDVLEASGESEQAEVMTCGGGTDQAVTADDMSAEEAEQRVRGLYRRLRGADHFRSLPALDRPSSPASPASDVRALWRRRRPVAHFSADLSVSTIHGRLRSRLSALADRLETPLRDDLYKYVEFIGTGCLDPEDEAVKREMAEKVMRLLLRREDGAGERDLSCPTSQPSRLSTDAADSGRWDAQERPRWPPPPPGDSRGSTERLGARGRAETDKPIGAWRYQLTRTERRLQAGAAAADGGESEASDAAWHSHHYSRAMDADRNRGRQTDTTSSDYDFNTIRSRQRRLEDATASSFEYYDPAPRRRRSSPDEGASAPEPVSARSRARSVSPPSPAPEAAAAPRDESDLMHLLRHTTDNVLRRTTRETRTRRTPVPPSTSSDAAAAESRHPRSRAVRGGSRSVRSSSGEAASRRLGALVGRHRQKHVQQLQREIDKLGRLERMLLGGTTVELDDCDWSDEGRDDRAPAAGGRRGVEGRSSPSDSDDSPPDPSSAYARIRETLQRRRQKIEAQLAEMDRRHRQYGSRLERFSDLPEETGSPAAAAGAHSEETRSARPRRTVSAGTESRSQETTTQTTSQTTTTETQTSGRSSGRSSGRRRSERGSQCDPDTEGASVQVFTRRTRVLGSDVSTQTTSADPTASSAVQQVYTRRTKVPEPSDSATQTTSAAPTARRSVTVTRRAVSPSPPRRSSRSVQTSTSPQRTVTVTRRRAVPEPQPERRPSSAVETTTRRRRIPEPEPEQERRPSTASVTRRRRVPTSASSRREVHVSRRPVADGGSADTETVSTAADTTADTTPNTTPTAPATARSATSDEAMRDALEPSERAADLERAERLLEAVGGSTVAAETVASVSSGSSGSSDSRGHRSPDAGRAQCLMREDLRVDELERALHRAEYCQEPTDCPVSPRGRRWAGDSSGESRCSAGTQTNLLPDGTFRCETVRRQVHSEDSEEIHHPPRPPSTRRSVAYFLSVRRGPLPRPCDDEPRCRRVLPAVRLSQELLRQQGLPTTACSDSTTTGTGTDCVREQDELCSEDGRRVTVTQRRPAGRLTADECITLQEALCRRRPDYIRNASVRRQYLQKLAELRQCNLERAARAAQTLPDVPTDADWCHFADALRPETVRRAFDYRDMRQHTERLWRRLPEIRDCVSKRKKHAQFRTNRLMWQVYRQKLQERCLRGDVHMTHRDAVLGGL